MTKQDKNTHLLAHYSIAFILLALLGNIVVSFKIIDLLYLICFCSFLCIYKINSRKEK
jgi:hypothetical protein